MRLHPAQSDIAKDRHRFRVLRCGRRFGKTALGAEEIKGVAISRPTQCCYIATTYQQARDIAWKTLLKELQPAIISTNESRLEIVTKTLKGGESTIFLKGWESIESSRGQAFDFLVVDEVASMRNFWSNWNEVLRPTLTDRKGQALFASTPKGFNHFYDLCNKELTDKDFRTFHYTSWDNPHIPPEEIQNAKDSLPDEVFAQEYMASFQKMQGLVYKEFDRKRHTYDTLPSGRYEKIAGLDFGYRNPAAVLHIYVNGDKYFIEDEWYKVERTDAQIAEYVSSAKFTAVYPDPENPAGIEELRRRGVNAREVFKGKGDISGGIQRIRELLLNKKLMINKRCINTISEFEMYAYDEDNTDKNAKENPLKLNDHAMDALRYVVLTYQPSGKVSDVQKMMAVRNQERLTGHTR